MPRKAKQSLTFQQHRRNAEDQALAMLIAESAEEGASENSPCRQFHTGPKTPMGKAASSQNARKHGLCSITLLLPDENPEQHQALAAGLYAEYEPATMTEQILVQEMIDQHWSRIRVRNREAEAFHSGADLDDNMVRLCQRYAVSHQRAFDRALKTLRQIQRERREKEASESVSENEHQAAAAPATPAAEAAIVLQTPQPAQAASAEFVLQKPQSAPANTAPVGRSHLNAFKHKKG